MCLELIMNPSRLLLRSRLLGSLWLLSACLFAACGTTSGGGGGAAAPDVVADMGNNIIRKITPPGIVTTTAGFAGYYGSADGIGSNARFFEPSGVAVDTNGNVYVADHYNYTIRKITPAGAVTTLAGLPTVAGLRDGTPFMQAVLLGSSGSGPDAPTIATVQDGAGSGAWFNQPKALAVAAGLLAAMGLIPGMPNLAFLFMDVGLFYTF